MTTAVCSGFTLIELLISLLLSGLLLVTLSRLYIDAQQYFIDRHRLQTLEENARFARWFLAQESQKAGFRRRPEQSMDQVFTRQKSENCSFAEGEVVAPIEQGFCLRYQPRQTNELTCEGTGIDGVPHAPYKVTTDTPIVVSRLTFDLSGTSSGSIRCNGQPLINGLADAQWEFGIGKKHVERFVKANEIGNLPILAIRYHLLLSDEERTSAQDNSAILSQWKTRFPQSDHPNAPVYRADFSGQRFYKIISGTLPLRNRLP